jgi:hypothetical protein
MDEEGSVLDGVLDAAQAAVILGVTRQHVVHLCRTGRLAGRRLTSTWVTTRRAVEEYSALRRRPGRPKSRASIIGDDRNIIDQSGDWDD